MKPETEVWIEVAENDFRAVTQLLASPGVVYEVVGNLSQQCIEKYLKAVLEEADRHVPRTHSLATLVRRSSDLLPELHQHRLAIEDVMPFVASLRYPHEPIEMVELEEEAKQAAETMRGVRSIVRRHLGAPDEANDSP